MDEREDSSDDTPAGATLLVASPDVEEEDRRTKRSLIIACLLALLLAVTAGLMNSNRSTANIDGDANGETTATGSSDSGAASSQACPVSPQVEAALSTARTPWDYMLILGYPKYAIGDVLNQRAEAVMQEADGEVQWDPASSNGRYSDEAQLILIVGVNDETVEISDTQAVMGLLEMEAFCPANTQVVLPVLS